jgi:hypothetical protein
MNWLDLLAYFFGGVFLCNAIPHGVGGLMGQAFQTPFAKPPGRGLSSSTVNVLWGFFNAAVAYALLGHVGHFSWKDTQDVLAGGAGALLIGLLSARHFGRFHGGNLTERS